VIENEDAKNSAEVPIISATKEMMQTQCDDQLAAEISRPKKGYRLRDVNRNAGPWCSPVTVSMFAVLSKWVAQVQCLV